MNIQISLTKKITGSAVALIFLLSSCFFMLNTSGVDHSLRSVFLLSLLIIILNCSTKAFWYLAFPMVLFYTLYAPFGLKFGRPNFDYIASIYATNITEAKELFFSIPTINYLYPLLIMVPFLLFRYTSIKLNIKLHRNKTFLCISVIIVMLDQIPSRIFKDLVGSCLHVKDEISKLKKLTPINSWGETTSNNSKYNNYILVIGESARKDYHGAYGYPVNNTPFMSNSNGILVDGLLAGGEKTISSLRIMLTLPDKNKWEPSYNLNLIDLINSSGMETYWVSNQGYLGYFDTPISAIAEKSKHTFFLKSGEFYSKNTSDFLLLNNIKKIISDKNKNRFIVIHLYGSHTNHCDRVSDYRMIVNTEKYKYINCYISSIRKTDDFLEQLNKIMNENKESYSMIYFSDHGLTHEGTGDSIYLNNGNKISTLHYEIPLYKINSDSNSKKSCKSFKSALNFTNGIANWVGIKNKKLSESYDLFDCKDDYLDFPIYKKKLDTLIDKKEDSPVNIN
ncbi:phosphoethanolamine transferase [Morganella morganii]|uniref:phosphoethanolamine transferase n=1 Tax=Morganella morganii TaxID=582 RepID=UPI000BFDD4EB|nr:phosphoethanolamine transferase [Morganella morganii]PHH10125.1 hypothetical protein CRX48_17110 [Morganella morganii]HDU8565923.1 phosphoethanolamine transferase [Morganella morganii]